MRRIALFFTFALLSSGDFARADMNLFSPQRFSGPFGSDFSGIFAGDPVKKSGSGWTSTVFVKLASGSCSGTLIAPSYVLTAAHCGVKNPLRVSFFDGEKIVDSRTVAKTYVHPNYHEDAGDEDWGNYNDIAILQLELPAPAPYLPVALIGSVSQLSPSIVLQGFGRTGPFSSTNVLTSASMKVESIDLKNYMMKLVDPNKKQSACSGDSGGPSYLKEGNKLYLAAVTSYIDAKDSGCADPLHATFAVLVVNYIDWIRSVVSGPGAP